MDPVVAILVFDSAVNCGPRSAIKFLQRAVNNIGKEQLTVDGKVGPMTIKASKGLNGSFISKFSKARMDYYHAISTSKPKLKAFMKGWSRRVVKLSNKVSSL